MAVKGYPCFPFLGLNYSKSITFPRVRKDNKLAYISLISKKKKNATIFSFLLSRLAVTSETEVRSKVFHGGGRGGGSIHYSDRTCRE